MFYMSDIGNEEWGWSKITVTVHYHGRVEQLIVSKGSIMKRQTQVANDLGCLSMFETGL